MLPSKVYCRCGTYIGKDYPATWGPNGGEPGFYDGITEYWSDLLEEYFCSQECLDEYEPEEEDNG
jgi:hypothetical protein